MERQASIGAAEYQRAMELWPSELARLVRNLAVAPHWLPGEDRFWYRHEDAEGHRFVMVDATTGATTPAFDHGRVGAALRLDPKALPLSGLALESDAVLVTTAAGRMSISLPDYHAVALPADDPASMPGPLGKAIFSRDGALWLRDVDGRERRLTEDGDAASGWGRWPDADTTAVARSRSAVQRPPFGCFWSPDGAQLLARHLDESDVEPYPYFESVPARATRPHVHWIRQRIAGEAGVARSRWQLLGIDDGIRIDVRMPVGAQQLEIDSAASGCVFWQPDGHHVLVKAATSNDDHIALLAIDRRDGACRIIHEECVDTWFDTNTNQYHRPNIRLLPGGRELLWYSQADGWGHLYVIDIAAGCIARRLTEGSWAVQDVMHVADGAVFFTACGREYGRHPYHRHLYRVALDAAHPNQALTLLTPEDADHPMSPGALPLIAAVLKIGAPPSPLSPSGRYFVDSPSTVTNPPVTNLRDARTGALIIELARADASELLRIGWRPPEAFSAKAADAETDMYGVILKPRDFDPARRYPVVERVYGGPQMIAQPRNFAEAIGNAFVYGAWSMVELGFVVLLVDGPGTPGRSKSFHDMTWDQPDRWGISHHRAAIEGAAATRPWMDLQRVGIMGHSYGGYATAMALLLEPGFYKVGVSSAGMYDPMWAQQYTPERHLGRPDFGGGRATKNSADEIARNYAKFSPSQYAERLEGRLLLVYGDIDENIQPASLLAFSAALISAGKQFDLLCLPGRTHAFFADPYFQKRTWDYFVEYLQGREPLRHLKIEARAAARTVV